MDSLNAMNKKICVLNDKKTITNVFWTGGWDSTYMLIKLLKQNKTVQPIYVIDNGRASRNNEMLAMAEILKHLENLGGEVLPIVQININEIKENEEISNSYKNLCKKVRLGSQYDWIARLALEYPGIAMGIEKPNGEFSGCLAAIEKTGKLIFKDGVGFIDVNHSSQDCINIFGNVCFPIIELTETDMVKDIKEWGLEKVMKYIWFCHAPINGIPCGTCRPCQQKMECKMNFLLPPKSQLRYKIFHLIERTIGKSSAKLYSKFIHSHYFHFFHYN